jgi:carotenoid cleavage dioxygenase-like enzyme
MSTTLGPLPTGADLRIEGELPADLDGVHVHIVDGMLHRVTISGGRARHDDGVVGRRVGVNVVRHHGAVLAMGEGEPPSRIGPRLETLGEETFGGQVPAGVGAHPRIDPRTGEMLAFRGDPHPPFLTWTVIGPDGTGTPPRPVEGVARPSVIHDMALTGRYVVLVVAPWFVDGDGGPPVWDPRAGTRIAVVPRDGGPVRWCEDETFWSWHTVNAHDAKDPADPVVDVVVLDYVEWAEPAGITSGPHLARATIDPSAGTVRREVLADDAVELPRIDDRLLGLPHRTAAFALHSTGGLPAHPTGLAWHDVATGRLTRWEPANLVLGEPAFAPDPRSDAPERGWWLAVATPVGNGESSLLVLPADDPAAGPLAAVRLPVRVPAGHGTWLPTR